MHELEQKGVLCARINRFEDTAEDPQIAHNNMIVEMIHPEKGSLRLLGNPIRLRSTPPKLKQFPPDLGEQSIAIVRELGYTDEQIEELSQNHVLG